MTTEPWPPFRVLCVDDNRDCADSTAMLLRVVGFEARSCYDGPTALQIAETFCPSICFLDLNMPGMGGDELAVRLREQAWCPILVVALTATNSEESRARTAAAGIDLHLVKPVNPQKLVGIVNALFQFAESAKSANNLDTLVP